MSPATKSITFSVKGLAITALIALLHREKPGCEGKGDVKESGNQYSFLKAYGSPSMDAVCVLPGEMVRIL